MKSFYFSRTVSAYGRPGLIVLLIVVSSLVTLAQSRRTFSGTVVTPQFELVPNVSVEIETSTSKLVTTSDAEGAFSIQVPDESIAVKFFGKNLPVVTRIFAVTDKTENLQIKISYTVAPINENVTIRAEALTPEIEQQNETIFKNKLVVARDDQILQSLNAGISVGQHEGGGKSIEIRRFGFNIDHGGVNGGLKVLVDNIQQNQGTQAHGQGFLGTLKSLSSELVEDITVLNGPFSAQFGDFSGLGVVQIHQKESLPQQLILRFQGGSFDTARTFLAYSPQIKNVSSFLSYEGTFTNGPFINPLRYRRHNVTGNLTYKIDENQAIGFKLNFGTNDTKSSGEIPVGEVYAGRLDRFGALDTDHRSRVRGGTIGTFYRKEFSSGKTFKVDGFLGRSLYDLVSNFTIFLLDPIYGDEILQHDSRLQEGVNVQYLQPYKLGNRQSLLTIGGNFHANQINVDLSPSIGGSPNRKFRPENINFRDENGDGIDDVLQTLAHANVNNYSAYIQNGIDFFHGHVHVEAGLRLDTFTFDVKGSELAGPDNQKIILNGKASSTKLQPKFSVTWSPFETIPVSFYANYGRGISSQDARGIIRNPGSPKVSTTDFYQTGAAYNSKHFSVAPNFFFIDRSNEQVYIPDDGTLEFKGPSRSYGFEIKTSARYGRYLSFNAGLTQVIRSFFRGQFTDSEPRQRIVVDTAPHTTANGSLVLTEFRGFNSFVTWRHISNYRLDGGDPSVVASGNDVIDFSLTKHLRRWVDLNFLIDNVLNKKYFETQQYRESKVCPTCEAVTQIHFTPGYPRVFTVGVTFRLFKKN